MNKKIVDKIKGKGYWRVIVRPTEDFYSENRFSLEQLKKVVADSQVRLRGWYYPHFSSYTPVITLSQNKIGFEGDWDGYIDYWELSRSGQFSGLSAIREDYTLTTEEQAKIRESFVFNRDGAKDINKFLELIGMTYRFTEIYLFASNFVQAKEFYDVDKFEVIIELHDVKDRMLFIWDWMRELWAPYICNSEEPIRFKKVFQKNELIANFDKIALENIEEICRTFNWDKPSMGALVQDQAKLLERRL